MYTASSLLLRTLSSAGITHAFVNWGSDHPALLEDLSRQRLLAPAEQTQPRIITCPNEMVALSAAQGYAQVTGRPAAVVVHVDVGTQALAGAIHNVDRSNIPVLIYAGASPLSSQGEHRGTRNEWIMWLQDIPDQSAIVRQYMRFTSQIGSAATLPGLVKRGLQIATSAPKGPVYLWARREVMEEQMDETAYEVASAGMTKWPAMEPGALSDSAADQIAHALLTASHPLILTSHLARFPSSRAALTSLSTLLALPIMAVCPSGVSCSPSFPFFLGTTFLAKGSHTTLLKDADVIVILECPLPWIPANDKPSAGARVFVLDSGDPLRTGMGAWDGEAEMVCRADPGVALRQVQAAVRRIDADADKRVLGSTAIQARAEEFGAIHARRREALVAAETAFPSPSPSRKSSFTLPNVLGVLRARLKGKKTLILNEAISNYPPVWDHLGGVLEKGEEAGTEVETISSGGSSLGWGLGAAVGAFLGAGEEGAGGGEEERKKKGKYDLVVLIVGDGSFLFGVPGSAYWMARKYGTPFLTVVLNNGGWRSPKLSLLAVHPTGHGSTASGDELTVGFGPDSPDFVRIAEGASAGWAWGVKVGVLGGDGKAEEGVKAALETAIGEAVRVVLEEKRCAVMDCVLESI